MSVSFWIALILAQNRRKTGAKSFISLSDLELYCRLSRVFSVMIIVPYSTRGQSFESAGQNMAKACKKAEPEIDVLLGVRKKENLTTSLSPADWNGGFLAPLYYSAPLLSVMFAL